MKGRRNAKGLEHGTREVRIGGGNQEVDSKERTTLSQAGMNCLEEARRSTAVRDPRDVAFAAIGDRLEHRPYSASEGLGVQWILQYVATR